MTIWMMVSSDELELPLAVARSQAELARIIGIPAKNIASAISHAKKKGYKSRYVKVEIEEGA